MQSWVTEVGKLELLRQHLNHASKLMMLQHSHFVWSHCVRHLWREYAILYLYKLELMNVTNDTKKRDLAKGLDQAWGKLQPI